jgi:hypothetical protein
MKLAKTRPFTHFIKRIYRKKDLIGVEIGILKGSHAINLISTLPINRLYLVDPFIPYDISVNEKWDMESMYKIAMENLSPYMEKIVFIRKKSEDAIEDIPNELDFVYVDGNHLYDFVKRDINLYYQKLKKGGILGGHDYNYKRWPEVTVAVNEFAKENNLKLYSYLQSIDSEGTEVFDWWVIKP